MGRNLLFLLFIGLIVYTVIDVVRSENDERLGLHPAIWVLAILLFPLLGSVIWLAVSRGVRARPQGPARDRGRRPPRPSAGPVAPDDDPEFLWRLEQRQRQADRDATQPKSTDDDGSGHDHPDPRGTTP